MVLFIHGDSFDWGSGNLYDGAGLAAYGNIVVVTMNYRLGVLGELRHHCSNVYCTAHQPGVARRARRISLPSL